MMRMLAPLVVCLAICATAAAQTPPAQGRVTGADEFADAITTQARIDAQRRATQAAAALKQAGVRFDARAQASVNDLQWPLRAVPGYAAYDYHGTKYFVDHDLRYPNLVQDYTCGTRTYDLASGYNHGGTDYFLWPYPWLMMDQGVVQVVAAAPGTIVDKQEGNFDRQCAFDGVSHANLVQVRQDDGLTAIYMHLRNGSVTSLPIGTHVAAGDYLGLVGSSGQSTGPHLHFELHDANGAVVDPRHGACNAAPERWAVLQPYEDPRIDTLTTHYAEPTQIVCGYVGGTNFDDVPRLQDVFSPGNTLWVFAAWSDHRNGEVTAFRILRPDGSVFAQWDFDLASEHLPQPFYSGTSFDWSFALPTDAPLGNWQVGAVFQGKTYMHAFAVTALDQATAAAARRQVGADATRCRLVEGQAAHDCP